MLSGKPKHGKTTRRHAMAGRNSRYTLTHDFPYLRKSFSVRRIEKNLTLMEKQGGESGRTWEGGGHTLMYVSDLKG